jgi:membrane protease subunit (stomatin/prohibitin family)
MCSLSFRPGSEEVRQIETRVAFDTQAQTNRSLISAGLTKKLNKNIDNNISNLIRNENCTCMKICSILDRDWCKECIGLVSLILLHLNHNTPLRTLINVPIVKEMLLDCMIVDFDDADYSLIVHRAI